MIKHVLLLRLHDEAGGRSRAENIKIGVEMLRALPAKVPCIREFEVAVNDPAADESNFDISLISSFDSMEALEEYQVHPEHVKVAEFLKSVRRDRACVDYLY